MQRCAREIFKIVGTYLHIEVHRHIDTCVCVYVFLCIVEPAYLGLLMFPLYSLRWADPIFMDMSIYSRFGGHYFLQNVITSPAR